MDDNRKQFVDGLKIIGYLGVHYSMLHEGRPLIDVSKGKEVFMIDKSFKVGCQKAMEDAIRFVKNEYDGLI